MAYDTFRSSRQTPVLDALTPREYDILQLMTVDLSNAEIAERLVMTPGTVKWYVKEIYSKLDVHSRDEAIDRAADLKLVQQVRSAPPTPTNLPAPTTALVGREREISAVRQRLQRSDVRLLTLIGTPGIGKTRLSLETAATLLGDFPDGVYFVPLAPVSDPVLVPNAIAQTLGVQEMGGQTILDILKHHLREKSLLLVLDNFEHLLSAAPLVAELLTSAPRLKVLATSREALRLYGEQEYPVAPLALPDPKRTNGIETLGECEAVALFVKRAQAIKPEFDLTQENASAIAAICIRLDGLPLAIELAAARVKLHTPQALLGRLDKRLSALTGGARDLPERQQTLRAAIAWSYDLLNASEKMMFARLGVFVGGWSLEALETVCSTDLPTDVYDGLESLLNKSLVQQIEGSNGLRLLMLETIREYALEKLGGSGEEEAIRKLHAEYFLALAERAAPELRGAHQLVWMKRLEEEYDNLRAVMRWLLHGNQTETLQRLGVWLVPFWHDHGYITEGRNWLEIASPDDDRMPTPVRAKTLEALFSLSWAQADYPASENYAVQYLTLAREMNDEKGIAEALHSLGGVALAFGDYDTARACYEESRVLYQNPNKLWSTSFALAGIGEVAYLQGDYAAARSYFEEDLVTARESDSPQALSAALNGLAKIADMQGDYEAAQIYAKESLLLAQKVNNQQGVAIALNRLGRIARQLGDHTGAASYHEASLSLARTINSPPIVAFTLNKLGEVAVDLGDYQAARQLHREALILNRDMDDPYYIADNLYYLALVSFKLNQLEEALSYLHEALHIAHRIQALVIMLQVLACFAQYYVQIGELEQGMGFLYFVLRHPAAPAYLAKTLKSLQVVVEGVLPPAIFAEAWAEGEAITLEQAVAYALEQVEA